MITDGQVRKLRRLLWRGESVAAASRKTGMDEKTGRKYRDSGGLPSMRESRRTWRTRVDPFAGVWPEAQERLEAEPRLRAFTLFDWLQERYPGRFSDSQRRTFERRVRAWRARHGRGREVMFPQVHDPGGLGASDFTNMNSLRVTIAGQPFDHMVYHFTLTYSNWESVTVCFSESFEALSRGLQEAFWRLGGVPGRHRSDSLSAAVNNLSEDREFRARYRDLMDYYQVEPQRINVGEAHENGDVESSHGHFKTAVDQALLLRGSRDFASRQQYERFLQGVSDKRNASRWVKLAEEEACLGELPPGKLDYRQRITGIKVRNSSTIQVKRNTYSVPSRLIGEKVDVVIDANFIEVRYADIEVQRMPRLAGHGKHAINYRHVIDSLVRKPGAFENYQYREDMFPSSQFRIAYDELCGDHGPRKGVREYLKILQLAARESQDAVQDALRLAITRGEAISSKSIRLAVEQHQQAPPVTEVNVEPPDLDAFDSLLQHPDMEVDTHEPINDQPGPSPAATSHGQELPEAEHATDGAVSSATSADVPGTLREFGEACGCRTAQPRAILVGIDGAGMPGAAGEPDHPSDEPVATSVIEDVAQLQVGTASAGGDSADGEPARRLVPGPSREPAGLWQTRFWKEPLPMCLGRAIGSSGSFCLVHYLQPAGAGSADRQTRFAIGQADQKTIAFRWFDHRRCGLRATKPGGDGGAVHASGGAVRTRQRDADEQPAVLEVGADLQRRDDHRSGDRPPGASQRDPGTERTQLSARTREETRHQPNQKKRQVGQPVIGQNQTGILIVAKGEK
jgi:hypothetical protein